MAETLKILMLEDNDTDAELVHRLLTKNGLRHDFTVVSDKESFLDTLDKYQPDLILADNSLPQFNAAEALTIARERSRDIPFIMVTGTASEEYAANIIKAGADDYILKDRLARLPAAIEAAIRQKRAEASIRHSEETRKLIMNYAMDAIICMDVQGKVTVWNPQAEKTFGWTEQEMMGKRVSDTIIPEQYRQRHESGLKYYLEFREGVILNKMIEITALDRNGREFPIELTIVPIRHENEEFFCAFLRDISERRKAEQQIVRERNLLRTVIDNLPDYIYVKDRELRHLINNSANVKLIGANSEEETIGKTVFDYFDPELAEKFAQDDNQILENKAIVINREELLHTNNGESHWLLTTKLPLKDKEENVIGLVGISRDITEHKKSEKEILQINEQLRQLSAHLQNIREDERTNMAREIHDELGQQMTVMKMDISWLNKKLEGSDAGIRQKMEDLVAVMDDTIKTIRRIASELRPSLLDDMGLTAAIEWHLREFEKRSGIHTSLTAMETEPMLPDTTKTGLFRIVQESLTNVARHAQAKNVSVSLQQKDKQLILTIADDGVGFDQQRTAAKKTLGLLGMKERISMMGGTYQIDSTPGKGTRVIVSISDVRF